MSETALVKEVVKPDRPKIVASWKDGNWVIDVKDEDGEFEITPRMRNLFMKSAVRVLKQRYRKFRVRARMQTDPVLSGKPAQ